VDAAAAFLEPVTPRRARVRLPGEKTQKLARALASPSPAAFFDVLRSTGIDPSTMMRDPSRRSESPEHAVAAAADFASEMMHRDLVGYLPDDILVKVDRASMAVGLEARVPLLDLDVVRFATGLPLRFKIRDGQGKWILRKVLARHVPRALFERPKSGFSVPIGDWLRGPLRPWAESLLDPAALAREGILNPGSVQTIWSAHLAGAGGLETRLWTVLMLQAWLDQARPGRSGDPEDAVPSLTSSR
jgi:asparagine synthase (glutamine-hydrolysing)